MNTPRLAYGIACGLLLGGCSTTIPQHEQNNPLINPTIKSELIKPDELKSAIYLNAYRTYGSALSNASAYESAPLESVLKLSLPDYTFFAKDSGVNLRLPVTMNSGPLPVETFLRSLSTATGYNYDLNGKTIEISGFVSKQWILPMLATSSSSTASVTGASSSGGSSASGSTAGSTGSSTTSSTTSSSTSSTGGTGGTRGATATLSTSVDEWDKVIAEVTALLGATPGAAAQTTADATGALVQSGTATPPSRSQVVADRSLGVIRAFGPAQRISRIDDYLTGLEQAARKQVRLDVRAIEVSLNDQKSRGINWNAALNTIFNNALGTAGLTVGAGFPSSIIANGQGLTVSGSVKEADRSIAAAVQLLSSYGNVEIHNKPQVTVLNGRTGYIGSGEEFGYVASVTQTVSNGAVVATPQLNRILVGVELQITPRVLPDNKIMLEVVPIISTFSRFDNFTFSGNTFSQPRIVLNQLKTEVIATSGQPIHIGGLMTSTLNRATTGLPLEEGRLLGDILNPVFGSADNQLNRRELILVITPFLSTT